MSYDNVTSFKIRKLQRLYRKNRIIRGTKEFLNLDFKLHGQDDFNAFSKYIRRDNVKLTTSKYLKLFNNYKNGMKLNERILITAYMITLFTEELLGKEMHQMDRSILEWSQEVVKRINLLDESKDIDKLWLLLNNYYLIFNQWKESDKSRMVESIIISYYNRCKHIEQINADTKISPEEKKIIIAELENMKAEVLGNVKFFDPHFDVENFKENYELIYEGLQKSYQELHGQISNTMKKAYYDMLKEELSSGNVLPIAEIMTEISKRLLIIVPEKRRESFANKINVEVIVDLLCEKRWTNDLKEYIKFICESIFVLGAQCDDEVNKKWNEEVVNLMNDNYATNLPLILIQIEEKLDRIYQLIMEFNDKTKK
tara:strand:- start:277 stop:1386 length:1110 start_codon:yes stop_codon:yes gene_type:complete